MQNFPRLKKRGLIEAILIAANLYAVGYLSTLEKAWPH